MGALENQQHEIFAVFTVKNPECSGADAAIAAGYSAASARTTASRLLKKADVQARITELREQISRKSTVDAAWLLDRLADEAQADVADLFNDQGDIRPVHEWPLIWRQGLVGGIEVEALFDGYGAERTQVGFTKKIKLSDRVKRLELIGKHVGVKAFEEVVRVNGLDALADRLARAAAMDAGADG